MTDLSAPLAGSGETSPREVIDWTLADITKRVDEVCHCSGPHAMVGAQDIRWLIGELRASREREAAYVAKWERFRTAVLATDESFQKIASVLGEMGEPEVASLLRATALQMWLSVQDDESPVSSSGEETRNG